MLVDKVQSAERNWERRCVPPDKLDPDNTNQCHEEILGSGQKRLKAECNQKTIDHVPKSIYAQRTIMSLPGHKYCVPTYGGEVELYPVTTKDCNTQPLAERLQEMEKDRSSYNNVDVNPAQTRELDKPCQSPIEALACEPGNHAHLDKRKLWRHPLVEPRNTKLEPGLEFAQRDELGTDTAWRECDRYHQSLYIFDQPRANKHPSPQYGGVISGMSRSREDCVTCLNKDVLITKELSSALKEANGEEGSGFPHPGPSAAHDGEILEKKWSEETITDFDKEKVMEPAALDLPNTGQDSHKEAQNSTIPVSPPKFHVGARQGRQLEMQASAVRELYIMGSTDVGKTKRVCKRDTRFKTSEESYLKRARGKQNVDDLKVTRSVSEHPAAFHLLQSLKGDSGNLDREMGPGEHTYSCQCHPGSNVFHPLRPQSCPSHHGEDMVGQPGTGLGQRKELGHQVFQALRDTVHHLVMCGRSGAKDLRKTLRTPVRIYWQMLKNIGVVTK